MRGIRFVYTTVRQPVLSINLVCVIISLNNKKIVIGIKVAIELSQLKFVSWVLHKNVKM